MEFVQAGSRQREQQSQYTPLWHPARTGRKGCSPGIESKHAKDPVAGKMRGFADQKMQRLKLLRGYSAVKRVNDLQQNTCSVLRGKQVRGKTSKDAEPQQCSPPRQN